MPATNRLLFRCSVYICLVALLNGQTTYNIVVVEDKISNGRNGVCNQPKSSQRIGQSCSTGWRVHNQTSGPKIQLSTYAGCKYWIKTNIQNCLEQNSFGALGSETCVRKQTYYYMMARCMRRWLEWETCDKSCGGGLSRRYKFQQISTTKFYEVETMACNTQPCPSWSPWQPSGTTCDGNCTRLWTRTCQNGTVAVDATQCAGTAASDSAVERRSCYVSMCKNFVELLPSTKNKVTTSTTVSSMTTLSTTPTKSTTTTNAPTTTTALNKRTKYFPDVGVIVFPKSPGNQTRPGVLLKPRLNENSVATEKQSGEDSKVMVYIGVLVGVLAFCILVLLTYIGMQKFRKGKLSVLPFRSFQSTTASQAVSQNTGGAAGNARSNQYHSSSIDRLIARVRALQQMATMRRNSPSSVYLQPDVPSGGPGQNSTPQFARNSSVRSVAFAENTAASYTAVPHAENRANNGEDPIYADIPAYRNNSVDDFTSDSDFDQLEEEPTTSSVPIPNGVGRFAQRREYSGSFVARQDPGGALRSQLRRCETERRGPLHEEIRRLGSVRPVPRPQVKRRSLPNYMRHGVAPGSAGWNQHFGEFGSDSPYTRPLKRRPGMGSVAESSQEDISVFGGSRTPIVQHRNSYPPPSEASPYLAPNIAPSEASDRTREPLPPQPCAENNTNSVSPQPSTSEVYSGSYNASHEFGFQRSSAEPRSARNSSSSVRSTSETSAQRDDYREPIDAARPAVNEAYAMYNVPFESRVPA